MNRRVVISAQVEEFVRCLAPDPRKRVRQHLDNLAKGLGDIRSLEEELDGYHRLRVGKYRIIFRYGVTGQIFCVFMETRALVYQLFVEAKTLIDPLRPDH